MPPARFLISLFPRLRTAAGEIFLPGWGRRNARNEFDKKIIGKSRKK